MIMSMLFRGKLMLKKVQLVFSNSITTYIQGQSPNPNTREYFYYIDHQGRLFLDDARIKNFTSCFKDKQFLSFFFKRLRRNDTNKYPDFPYLSPCGREKNYVKCDDCPIVFTRIFILHDVDMISFNHADDSLAVPFEPSKLYVRIENGRIYHPGLEKTGYIGLIQSNLAIELSKSFVFDSNSQPTHFIWKGVKHQLSLEWLENIKDENIFGDAGRST